MSFKVWLITLITSLSLWGADFEVPPLKGHVNDYARVLSPQTKSQLNQLLSRVKRESDLELAVLTVESLKGLPIEMASIAVVDKWQLGKAKQDLGLLVMLAKKERRLRIEVGRGLEGDITDAHSKRIIDQNMVPYLRQGDFDSAVQAGTYALIERALPDLNLSELNKYKSQLQPSANPRDKRLADLMVIIIFILIALTGGRSGLLPLLLLGGSYRGPYRGGGGFGGGGFGGGLGGGGGFGGGGASGGW